MRISLLHKYWTRLFAGVMAAAFLLGVSFPMTAFAAPVLPQEGSGTEAPAPETPPPPKPKPPPLPM